MAIAPIAAIAISHPQTKASARRRPDGMLSSTITVTTETGLVNATASPSAATSATSVPICHRPRGSCGSASHAGLSLRQSRLELLGTHAVDLRDGFLDGVGERLVHCIGAA